MVNPAKNTICLWYDDDAEGAANFYAETLSDSSVSAVHYTPGDYPSGKKGDVFWLGLSWQITPIALTQAITNRDPAAANRAFQAMME